MTHLKSVGKSILIGGAAAGIISLIPIINLLNLLFMMWMAFGGGLCVYLLRQENEKSKLKVSDAMVCGAVSGALGLIIFGGISTIALSHISPGKIERIMELLRFFSPANEGDSDITLIMQGDGLRTLFLTVMGVLLFISVISGALGGIISRSILKGKDNG